MSAKILHPACTTQQTTQPPESSLGVVPIQDAVLPASILPRAISERERIASVEGIWPGAGAWMYATEAAFFGVVEVERV